MDTATHVWRIKTRLPERTGESCRILARGRLNSCLVQFGDGTRVVTSRWAVRKKVAGTALPAAAVDGPGSDLETGARAVCDEPP